ncbi:hypothetical protein [Parapedobacter indicus]|uniref:Uncharacterized protein n=1 Tax=Parapedobacter indicus TaxID=1477437 RepID=A0A1I3E240_9SPHI|nr:hypothetical protein [Parapedobacter indicus]PPL04936.1 hypothetical protein CLV26_101746 [Parapedobacter indicus]SFH93037.1 hypothetical protein SAMN05444682_101732 [Parapedobacter indicus]
MATFISKFDFGDIVYLVTDPDQLKYIVCEIEFKPGSVVYVVSSGKETYTAYEFELSRERDMVEKLS